MDFVRALLFFIGLLAPPVGYIYLCSAMRRAALRKGPYLHFALVLGACSALFLTISFSGSIPGALVAILSLIAAPIAILVSSCFLYRRHQHSRFHRAAFWSGMGYVGLVMLLALVVSMMQP